jgi:hypothetical protein
MSDPIEMPNVPTAADRLCEVARVVVGQRRCLRPHTSCECVWCRLANAVSFYGAAQHREREARNVAVTLPPPERPTEPTVVVGGQWMERSLVEFERACKLLLEAEQAKLAPDSALIGLLCDAVRLCRERDRQIQKEHADALMIRTTALEDAARKCDKRAEQARIDGWDQIADDMLRMAAALRADAEHEPSNVRKR